MFAAMEEAGHLDMDNDNELYILHLVYLPKLDKELKMFEESYNNHRIEGHGIPKAVFLKGCFDVYGIQSPRLQLDIDVAELDTDAANIEENEFATRSEEHGPVVREVFLKSRKLD